MEVIGIDVGFGFTKATNGFNSVIFKSLLGNSTDIQFQTNFGDTSFNNNLHVSIENKSYFIGDFAEKQSNVRQFTLDQDKLVADFIKILGLTAAGTCSKSDHIYANIVSGLPIAYLKRDYKRFIETLKGEHKITYYLPDSQEVQKIISIHKVQMMPQPIGSIFNLIMNKNGKMVNKEFMDQKIGIIDIGFRTTDFSIFNKLQYVERGSSTIDTGMSKCFSIIADKLRQESGMGIELYRLYQATQTGIIKIKGKEYNITNLRDKIYSHCAGTIANDINRLWSDEWDMDTIVLTGGGSMELAIFLQTMIDGNVIPVENDIDTRLNNVQGYHKFGQYKWSTITAPETSPKKENEDHKKASSSETDPSINKNKANDLAPSKESSKGLKWIKK